MTRKASDISAQVARMTNSVVQVPPLGSERLAPVEVPRRSAKPRFTVIMPREQHRFIKRLALDMGTDASTVTRHLFTILEGDPALARRLRLQVTAESRRSWEG